MNIGIATFHRADNYGAVVQAHALQTFLSGEGHCVRIIDRRSVPPVSLARKWLGKTPPACLRKWERAFAAWRFQQFRDRRLHLTPERFLTPQELDGLTDRFDLLITGSDQVWNPQWIARGQDLADFHFLAFGGTRPRRISYAASFGHTDLQTLSPDDHRLLSDGLCRLDAISVRESSGVALVRALCGRDDALRVCDPTLLLNPAHYHEMAGPKRSSPPHLFQFMLHGRAADAVPAVRQIAADRSWRVLRCDVMKTGLHHEYTLPSPEAWLGCLRDAGLVVTNSFHAVVFCLLFQTPFVAVLIDGEIGSMNGRIRDLLAMVRLEHRMIAPGAGLPPSVLMETIDWGGVATGLAPARAEGVSFLRRQISLANEPSPASPSHGAPRGGPSAS